MTTNKYGAQPCYVCPRTKEVYKTRQSSTDIYFPSKWEAVVYGMLAKYVPEKHLAIGHKVLLKPKTRRYPALNWKADFAILTRNKQILYIVEAKGMVLESFTLKMKLLEHQSPKLWERTLVVMTRQPYPIDISGKLSVTLAQLEELIRDMKLV